MYCRGSGCIFVHPVLSMDFEGIHWSHWPRPNEGSNGFIGSLNGDSWTALTFCNIGKYSVWKTLFCVKHWQNCFSPNTQWVRWGKLLIGMSILLHEMHHHLWKTDYAWKCVLQMHCKNFCPWQVLKNQENLTLAYHWFITRCKWCLSNIAKKIEWEEPTPVDLTSYWPLCKSFLHS